MAIFCPVSLDSQPDAYAMRCVYPGFARLWADFAHSLDGVQWISFDAALMAAFYPRNGATNVYVRRHYRRLGNAGSQYVSLVD
ncbi:hypothetical protein EMIT0215P_30344 [Pseudomonas serboccidentalis]